MGKFVSGFAFAIVTMMAWAAWSGEGYLSQQQIDILKMPVKTFIMAGGEDKSGTARAMKMDADGNVVCVHPWPDRDGMGIMHPYNE